MQSTYQLNNFVKARNKQIVKIRELHRYSLEFVDQEGIEIGMTYNDVEPIEITVDLLKSLIGQQGIVRVDTYRRELHIEHICEIRIKGKFYYVRGFEYKDSTVWTIGNFNIRYFHMLQNYLKFIEPDFELSIF